MIAQTRQNNEDNPKPRRKGVRADPLANRPFLRSAAFSDFEFSFFNLPFSLFQNRILITQKYFLIILYFIPHTFAVFVAIK